MDFSRLQEFLTIAHCASIKKAAQELGISSATLSARLIRFEEHLGITLFLRKADTMVLTPAGEQLLPSAREILASYHKIKQDVCDAQAHGYRYLRIAVCGNELPMYLGPFLDELNRNHPEISLDILDDSDLSIPDGIQTGAVDLYFAPVLEEHTYHGIERYVVGTLMPNVVLPRTHPLAGRNMISLRELDNETFILYPQTAAPVIRDFQLRNLQTANIRFRVYETQTAKVFRVLLIPIGKGIYISPTSLRVIPPNSVCIPLTDLPCSVSLCCYYNKSNPNPDVVAFLKDFSKFAKELRRHEYK